MIHLMEKLLAETFGWDFRSLGPEALPAALGSRPAGAAPDLQALAEALVVPETWFFRDTAPFDFLAQRARAGWLPRRAGAPPIRILSAPCSSGEEPYSIVMTLLAAGVPAADIRVDALDASGRLLETARAGVYSDRALRETDAARRSLFTPAGPGRWAVPARIKSCVQFRRANILDLDVCADAAGPYQAVFCRNLLIYQHAAARRRVLEHLRRRLAPDGLLFVGHAEMLPLFDQYFEPAPYRGAFAYQRRRAAMPAPSPPAAFTRMPAAPPPPAPPALSALPAPAHGAAPPDLAEARRLADAGQLDAAAKICAAARAAQPLCAAAHLLEGLIFSAEGRLPEAEQALARALYIEPQNRAAMEHLALLHDRRGDAAGAARLRRRLAQSPEGNKY